MAFQFKIDMNNAVVKIMNPGEPVTFDVEPGNYQATLLPSTVGDQNWYVLSVIKDGPTPHLPPPPNHRYQFYIDHLNNQGVVLESFFVDGPHGRGMAVSGNAMTGTITTLSADGGIVDRAHLTLTERRNDGN